MNKKNDNKKGIENNNVNNSNNSANNSANSNVNQENKQSSNVDGAKLDKLTTDDDESNNTKGCKKGGPKVDANSIEKNGEITKVSLTVSEKALISKFNDLSGTLLIRLVNGKLSVETVKRLFDKAVKNEVKTLAGAGALDSSVTLNKTFKYLLEVGTVPTLESVRKIRIRIQEKEKAAKRLQEVQAKEKQIKELAKRFNLQFETAKAMFEAGALKL